MTLFLLFGRVEGWKGGRMEGWKDGRMEGWKDGRMEGALIDGFCPKKHNFLSKEAQSG